MEAYSQVSGKFHNTDATLSVADFVRPAFYVDWGDAAPSYLFLGGRLAFS